MKLGKIVNIIASVGIAAALVSIAACSKEEGTAGGSSSSAAQVQLVLCEHERGGFRLRGAV